MDGGLLAVGTLVAIVFIFMATNHRSVKGMDDKPVSLDNIRKGVARGWYKATLVRRQGKPYIYLYGKNAEGNNYGDIYPISEEDWQTLKAEHFNVSK